MRAKVLPKRGSSFIPLIKQQAVLNLKNGKSRKTLAQELGVSEYRLHLWLCMHSPQPENYTKALNLLKSGVPSIAVRDHFGGKMPYSNLHFMPFKMGRKK